MANLFLAVTAPAGNGSGAPVNFTTFGADKTVIISGSWTLPPTINVEVNNSANSDDGGWQSIFTTQGSGTITLNAACRWIRVTIANFKGGMAPIVNIGGDDGGTAFVTLVAPPKDGVGASVDCSALGEFKSVQVSTTFRGSTIIEVSNDGGATWGQEMAFATPGLQTALFTADFMRVRRNGVPANTPGLPIVCVGACVLGSGGGGAVQYLPWVNVKDHGATGDGITNDSPSIQAAIEDAISTGKSVYFPAPDVSYLLGDSGASGPIPFHHGLSIPTGTTNLRLWSDVGATIKWDSSTDQPNLNCGVFIQPNCSNIQFENLFIQGYVGAGDDNFHTNPGCWIFCQTGCVDLKILKCTFDSLNPEQCATSSTSRRHVFKDNYVHNSPLGINLPDDSTIDNSWFICDEVVTTRSHAVYLFGYAQRCKIINNHFKNIATQSVQIRASDGQDTQKGNFLIAGNFFEGDAFDAIWCGSDNQPLPSTWNIVGNQFKNSRSPIRLVGMRGATVVGNVFEWDWQFDSVSGNTGITLSSDLQFSYSTGKTILVDSNVFVNRHPIWASFHVASLPVDGDTFTLAIPGNMGGSPLKTWTWTWRAVSSSPYDVTIEANVDICATAIQQAVRGLGDIPTPMCAVLRDMADAWSTENQSGTLAGMCWIASDRNFFLSTTGGNVVASGAEANDNSGACQIAIYAIDQTNITIHNNSIDVGYTAGSSIEVHRCVSPVVKGNQVCEAGGSGILMTHNAWSLLEDNRLQQNVALHQTSESPATMFTVYDAFPVIRGNGQVRNITGCLPWMQGASGFVPIGDGKGEVYLFYGQTSNSIANSPRGLIYSWLDGDRVQISESNVGVTVVFIYQTTITDPLTQFNSYASLLNLINTQTSGVWVADNPVVTYFGSDAINDGYIRIRFAAVGANDPQALIDTTPSPSYDFRMGRTIGVVLRDWPNVVHTYGVFRGGAAAATKTVVWTPQASVDVPCFVQGVDAASQALNPICYQADTTNGVCYVITHSVAVTGTERFFFRAGA